MNLIIFVQFGTETMVEKLGFLFKFSFFFYFSGLLGTIFVLAVLEDIGDEKILVGVNALRRQQSQFSRIRRRSEAMATKLGPSFHTEPPTSYTFANDTGNLPHTYTIFFLLLVTIYVCTY